MPAALLATTLMIALGQVQGDPNGPMQPSPYPVPANSQGYGLGPTYGPGQGYAPSQGYGAAPAYGAMPGPGAAGSYGPNEYGQGAAVGMPGSLNNAYLGYRLTTGFGDGMGAGTSTFNYVYPNYDAYDPWVHGYWQELPAFGGHAYFRPYNYRHVYTQSEVAASWNTSAVMPYSHEYFRRPREQGIYEQRTSSYGRNINSSAMANRQPARPTSQFAAQGNNETISRTSGVRPAGRQPAPPTKQATKGPSLFNSRN